jgi:hypothetical protein
MEQRFEKAVRAMSSAWDLRVRRRSKWLPSCLGNVTWTHDLPGGGRSGSYGRATWREVFYAIAWHGLHHGLKFPEEAQGIMWALLHDLEIKGEAEQNG